jgi:hypothetical protein
MSPSDVVQRQSRPCAYHAAGASRFNCQKRTDAGDSRPHNIQADTAQRTPITTIRVRPARRSKAPARQYAYALSTGL